MGLKKMKKLHYLILILTFLGILRLNAQDITLYEQINGRYDFTFIGNTMNSAENNPTFGYITSSSSAAQLNMSPADRIIRAYLYWAGSGDGDFQVNLNGNPLTAERTFSHSRFFSPNTFTYFSAFKDITSYVQATGNGTYTLSDLDISAFEPLHYTRKTNFAGWAILIVYENSSLTLNQLNIYDGLQGVPDALQINLTNLFVLNNTNAKAGFIAWEGDSQLPTETFSVNNIAISNAINPINNVFNSTNSITGSNTLYNMDLDVYEIDNYVAIGDTSASITLSSSQDFIMINTVITKLNSQLPDATVVLNNVATACNSRNITINYSVYNTNSTEILPANTSISFYIAGQFFGRTITQNPIAIGGFETGSFSLNIPSAIPNNFNIQAVVDDTGNGIGIVNELNENNNTFSIPVELTISPEFNALEDITSCNLGLTRGLFDFSSYESAVKTDPTQAVRFYENSTNAEAGILAIMNSTNYEALTTPKEIFVRVDNDNCYSITSFSLLTNNCPPTVYNAVSANGDGSNDAFFIEGLRDVFLNFNLEIYNRWGKLVWTGNNSKADWDGTVPNAIGGEKAPEGTYYYVLNLNDPDYPNAIVGYLYLAY
jgi:gliding motility-associated-like protein